MQTLLIKNLFHAIVGKGQIDSIQSIFRLHLYLAYGLFSVIAEEPVVKQDIPATKGTRSIWYRARTHDKSAKRNFVRLRLELEVLEDRCTPDVSLLNSGFDTGFGTFPGQTSLQAGNNDLLLRGGKPQPDAIVNLQITSAFICDAFGIAQTAPVMGQMLFLRSHWQVTGSAFEQYIVRYTVDGVALDSSLITNNGDGGYSWYRGGWYASPGTHSVVVTIDGLNQVAESNEFDNQMSFNFTTVFPTDLPSLSTLYTSDDLNQEWFINNYADVNPFSGVAADYLGGIFQYDGHDAHDSGPQAQFFHKQDLGIPLIATNDGTVTQVADGLFDRENSSNNKSGNYILLNHGNNWETLYYHAAANTITVKVGDQVKRGQLLGYMGSSGNSTGTHIHFNHRYRGAVVETGYAPSSYWQTPPPYSGSVPTTLFDAGITNYTPSYNELTERLSPISSFSTTESGTLFAWTSLWNFKTTDQLTWRWTRPNGTFFDSNFTPTQNYLRMSWWYWSLPLSNFQSSPGTWQVVMRLNGTPIKSTSFNIGGGSVPSIKMLTGTTPLIDERSTPIEFGSVSLGGSPVQQTFSIQNHGNGVLNLSNLSLPAGFSVVGSLPSSVAANSSASLVLRLDTTRAGSKFGTVKFDTNDPDTPVYDFNISGTVTGAAPVGAPVVTLPGSAVAYNLQSLPRFLFPLGTITDSNSANFNGGSLTVTPGMGAHVDDRLAINSQGTGAGQISVTGSTVSYEGIPIGTFSGGSGSVPLVINFNSSATPVAAQALLRQITYASLLAIEPVQKRRYYSVRLVDDTLLTSTDPWKMVAHSGVKRAPTVSTLNNQSITRGTTMSQVGSFADLFGFSWSATVDYGDGSGVQPLSLNPDKTFQLSRQYVSVPGNYTVTVSVWNDQGGIEIKTFQTAVLAPIQVNSVQVNDGSMQRSQVTQLLLTFSRAVDTVDAGAFSLSIVNSVGIIPSLNVAWSVGNTVATITFSGAGVIAGSIADGRYRLELDATKLHDNTGGILDGNGDGLSGGGYSGSEFHRLFGDFNGNGTVDTSDRDLFFAALGSSTGDAGYNTMFDFNGDGRIDFIDYAHFRRRNGMSV